MKKDMKDPVVLLITMVIIGIGIYLLLPGSMETIGIMGGILKAMYYPLVVFVCLGAWLIVTFFLGVWRFGNKN